MSCRKRVRVSNSAEIVESEVEEFMMRDLAEARARRFRRLSFVERLRMHSQTLPKCCSIASFATNAAPLLCHLLRCTPGIASKQKSPLKSRVNPGPPKRAV